MYEHPYHTGELSNYHFLITGGAGFIGSNILEYLVRYKAGRIRVLDNFSNGHRKNLQPFQDYPGFELIEGDIRDMNTCRQACADMHFITHQAALGSVPRSVKDPLSSHDVNVNGFLNMLEAARQTGSVRKMIYAASSSVYGDSEQLPKVEDRIGQPLSPYALTKRINEMYASIYSRVYGFHTTGLRYFNIFGPRQDPEGPYAAVIPLFMKAAMEGKPPVIFGDGEQTRDFTFVENAVQANIKAMLGDASQHEVVNIACGDSVTLNALWTLIASEAGLSVGPRHEQGRPGDIRHSLADIAKAEALLGYQPLFDVRSGLKITFDAFADKVQ